MKTIQLKSYLNIAIGISMIATSCLFTSCEPKAVPEEVVIANEDDVADITSDGTIYTISDFINTFATNTGNFQNTMYPEGNNASSNVYIFKLDTLPTEGSGIYIRGRVATDDYNSNFYKELVLQQIVTNTISGDTEQQTIRILVDMGSVNGLYHQGQEILIRCNGLAIGVYYGQILLCVPTYKTTGSKTGWIAGKIPSPRFRSVVTMIGEADPKKLQYDKMTIAEFKAQYTDHKSDAAYCSKLDGNLIELQNVHFADYARNYQGTKVMLNEYNPLSGNTDGDPEKDMNANTFATSDWQQADRCLVDGGTEDVCVSIETYAKFAYYYLPAKITKGPSADPAYYTFTFDYSYYTGTARGVADFYASNAKYAGSWTLVPNSMNDFDFKDSEGNKWIDSEDCMEFSSSNYKVTQ